MNAYISKTIRPMANEFCDSTSISCNNETMVSELGHAHFWPSKCRKIAFLRYLLPSTFLLLFLSLHSMYFYAYFFHFMQLTYQNR